MSSNTVSDNIMTFVNNIVGIVNPIDITEVFDDMTDVLNDAGIEYNEGWTGIDFLPGSEVPAALRSSNSQGKYREEGSIFVHVTDTINATSKQNIKDRGKIIRDAFRGSTISGILIESVSTLNFSDGATLRFDGGYIAASIIISYQYDFQI